MSFSLLLAFAVVASAFALSAAALVIGFRKLRRAKHGIWRTFGWVVWVGLTSFFAVGLVGVVVGVLKARGAVGGESIDPSQKARILAERISDAMNVTALVLLVLLVIGVAFAIYAAVVRRRAAR